MHNHINIDDDPGSEGVGNVHIWFDIGTLYVKIVSTFWYFAISQEVDAQKKFNLNRKFNQCAINFR